MANQVHYNRSHDGWISEKAEYLSIIVCKPGRHIAPSDRIPVEHYTRIQGYSFRLRKWEVKRPAVQYHQWLYSGTMKYS